MSSTTYSEVVGWVKSTLGETEVVSIQLFLDNLLSNKINPTNQLIISIRFVCIRWMGDRNILQLLRSKFV